MNNQELKQAIIEDIEFLKTAKVDIIDKDTYYSKLKKYGWKTFGRLYLPVLILGLIFIKFSIFNHLENHELLYDYLVPCAAFGLIMPVMVSLFFLPKIMNWIVFEEQLLPHLKTKVLIATSVKKFFDVYWYVYLIWLGFGMAIFNPICVFIFEGTAIIFVTLGLHLMLYAELNRIGASVFFEYLSDFFDKEITRLPYK